MTRREGARGPRDRSELSDAERRRGLTVLLVNTFLMWAGFFMVIPLIAVHYVDGLGWAAGAIGLVLAVRQFTQQGLAFVGGIIADRVGAKPPIVGGMLVRGLGFVGMAWADTLPLLFATATLAALGGAFFEAPKSAAIAALTDEHNRARFYSLTGVVGGLGLTVGPLVGAALLRVDFSLVALASGACFLATGSVAAVFMPPVRVATASPGGLTGGMRLALRDRPFVAFTVLLMGYWFMFSQINISFPLVATHLAGTPDGASWVIALNAGMTVLLQYPLLRIAERWLRPLPILALGTGLMAASLAGVAFAGSVPVLLGCVVGFAVGGVLALPTQQTVAAGLANPAALGAYFGVGSYALAVGGALGAYSGGALYGLGERLGAPALPWLCFAAVGALTTVGLFRMAARGRRPAPVVARTTPEVTLRTEPNRGARR